jgi:hypothetical protein
MVEVDETWLRHVAVEVGVTAIFFGVTATVAQSALLQQLALIHEMASLVAPSAAICNVPIVSNPCLLNKSFAV